MKLEQTQQPGIYKRVRPDGTVASYVTVTSYRDGHGKAKQKWATHRAYEAAKTARTPVDSLSATDQPP